MLIQSKMKEKNIKLQKIRINGSDEFIYIKECKGINKYFGLMFKNKGETFPLLFRSNNPIKSIHSFFVFFPFIALWLDENYNVVDYKIVKPFSFSIKPKFPVRFLLEVPII